MRETPPRAVKIPSAAIIPLRSSGEVSCRTKSTLSFLAASTARSAFKHTRPDAAPGPAGSPLHKVAAAFERLHQRLVKVLGQLISGHLRLIAVFQSIKRSLTISTAILTAASPVRFPLRVWSM